ncbi:hypothetical protein COU36_04835 [Candidatus Micrarchaeota archaeon CG10_big_fil_rev_8_21_14_0_10_59_7]|nr:MAG: hypothetical protein COU36_04835 [Candidatus Micrarchaeota archaeon CG10_big_fil_rev_8_21_14_0_10_59_7]
MVRRAFIAAPLLGTIIFLAAIVFVVSLNKIEVGETAIITNDAYHNRIVSLLEIYRTDLGSVFRESLSRVIETYLTKECWWTLFDVRNEKADRDLEAIRFRECDKINGIIEEVVCSYASGDSAECQGELGEQSQSCEHSALYGLPAWIYALNETVPFEGITFAPANSEQFSVFLNSQDPNYPTLCRALLGGGVFDCKAFAEGNLQCCSVEAADENAPACEERTDETGVKGRIIPGCENGAFFVRVDIQDPSIYPIMPRIFSDDKTGNQVRSGAISDSNFYLPINYPLFRYYDRAFKVWAGLAYGKDAVKNTGDGDENGVVEGYCDAARGGQCINIELYGIGEQFSGDGTRAQTAERYASRVMLPACSRGISDKLAPGFGNLQGADKLMLQVCASDSSTNCPLPEYQQQGEGDWTNCTRNALALGSGTSIWPTDYTFSTVLETCGGSESGGSLSCTYIGPKSGDGAGPRLQFRFVDYDPAYRIDPLLFNHFCWWAEPIYYAP